MKFLGLLLKAHKCKFETPISQKSNHILDGKEELIKKLFDSSMTIGEIADHLHVSPRILRQKINELGLKREPRIKKKLFNVNLFRELVRMRFSDTAIADKFHVHPGTVAKWKKNLGIYVRDDERSARSKIAHSYRVYYKKTGELPECPLKTNVLEKYKDDIISLLESGTPKLKIAKRYGVSVGTVYNFIHLYGLRPPTKKICGKKGEILKEAFNSGKTIELISKKIKCSPGTVHRAIKDMKLTRDPKVVRRKSPLNDQEERIKALFYQGMPGTEIARQLGVTSTSVYAYLHKMKYNNSQRKVKRWTPLCKYDDELLRLRQDGMPLRKLAKHFGIHVNTVLYRLKRLEGTTSHNISTLRRNPKSVRTDEIIRNLCREGLNIDEISKVVKLSHQAIYKRLKKMCIPTAGELHRANLVSGRDEIITLYARGNSISAIAKKFNCTWKTIKEILIQEGIFYA